MLAAAAPAVLAAGIWVQQYRRSERGAAAGEGPYAELEEEELEAQPEVQHTAGPAKVRPNASSAASAQPRRPAAAARSSTPQLLPCVILLAVVLWVARRLNVSVLHTQVCPAVPVD